MYKFPCSIASAWFWPMGSHGKILDSQQRVRLGCVYLCVLPTGQWLCSFTQTHNFSKMAFYSYRFWKQPHLLPLWALSNHYFLLLPVLGCFTIPLWFPITAHNLVNELIKLCSTPICVCHLFPARILTYPINYIFRRIFSPFIVKYDLSFLCVFFF